MLYASPHIQKATAELEKMLRCLRMHLCIISEDNQRYRVAFALETTKSRRALLFEKEMSRGGIREINKIASGRKKASRKQLMAVSSNPSTGQQVRLSGSSFKEQKNSCVRTMQLTCRLPWLGHFVS